MHRGKLVVVSVFVLAVILATSGLIYRYLQTKDVVSFWGARPSQRISSPDRVELWELAPGGGEPAKTAAEGEILIQGRGYVPKQVRDVTKARGFINASSALMLSHNYRWDPTDCEPVWTHALLYHRGEATTVVAISLGCGWVYSTETGRVADIGTITEGLVRLFREQLGS